MITHLLIGIDWLLYTFLAFSVAYLLIFTMAGILHKRTKVKDTAKKHHFLILFPAYKEDRVIVTSVRTFLQQDYPTEYYDVVVISDKMEDSTNEELSRLPIKVLKINFEKSSKAKALNFAIKETAGKNYDAVIILDADNTVEIDFLSEINKAYSQGCKAIQAHRRAKNLNTDTAVLDAVSEEINNTIFRAGHIRLGMSSALIGSGMAFDYEWFKENVRKVYTAGEDKEFEALLIQQHIPIEYLAHVYVYDEKIQKGSAFKHQRRRWLAAQYCSLAEMWKGLPHAIKTKNYNYCDKVFQLSMFPRVINVTLILLMAIINYIFYWPSSIKWWILCAILIITLYLAIPKYLLNRQLYKAIKIVPILAIIMTANLFRLKGINTNFLHTNHGEKHK